jgi:hypothetical protein
MKRPFLQHAWGFPLDISVRRGAGVTAGQHGYSTSLPRSTSVTCDESIRRIGNGVLSGRRNAPRTDLIATPRRRCISGFFPDFLTFVFEGVFDQMPRFSEVVIATSAHVDIGGAACCPHVVAPFVWADPIFGDSPLKDDIRGKIVGICRDPEDKVLGRVSFFAKAMDAQTKGALGVVFTAERSSEIQIVADHGTDATPLTVPCALISMPHARKLRDDMVIAFQYRRLSAYYTFVYLRGVYEP